MPGAFDHRPFSRTFADFPFRQRWEDPLAGEFYIGSASDWMFRNLSRRVEAAAPVEDRAARERLWEILDICLQDRRQAWSMQPDGSYVRGEAGGRRNRAGCVGDPRLADGSDPAARGDPTLIQITIRA